MRTTTTGHMRTTSADLISTFILCMDSMLTKIAVYRNVCCLGEPETDCQLNWAHTSVDRFQGGASAVVYYICYCMSLDVSLGEFLCFG